MKLKILTVMVVMAFLANHNADAQDYILQTSLKTVSKSVVYPGDKINAGEAVFDASASTNDMTLRGGGIPFLLSFKSGTPTNILGISLWDGTNRVAEAFGPFPPLQPYNFRTNLARRDYGEDVLALQKFLNLDPRTLLGTNGPGSPSQETMTFGLKSQASLTNHEGIHGIFLDDGTLSIVLDEKTRAQINGLNIMKNYIVVWVPFTTNVFLLAGSTKVLKITVETSPTAYGVFSVGLTDPTDHYWDAEYTSGSEIGKEVTENFNPTLGSDFGLIVSPPRIKIDKFLNQIEIITTPGSAKLWTSTALPAWTSEDIFLENGVTNITLSLAGNRFFRVSQP